MTVILDPSQFHPVARELTTGIRVDRATDTLPQSTDEAIFSISGGRVIVVGFLGEVTTVIGAGTTPELTVVLNPTATGADLNLCIATSVASDAVGTLYSLSGTVGDALQTGLLGINGLLQDPLVLSEGDIEVLMDESVTGSVSWSLIYVPWDADAEVAATAV